MYCAYTIPGMTGSSLMYYYNGKAVRHTHTSPSAASSVSFSPYPREVPSSFPSSPCPPGRSVCLCHSLFTAAVRWRGEKTQKKEKK
uniref:Uncharacterized protein n=1 Tax=Labrus bergylta TaxID=56723 RepID=A0A3Q3F800_9LABR